MKLKKIYSEIKLFSKITPKMVDNIYKEIYLGNFQHLDQDMRIKFYHILDKHNVPVGIFTQHNIWERYLDLLNISQLAVLYNDLLQFKTKYIK